MLWPNNNLGNDKDKQLQLHFSLVLSLIGRIVVGCKTLGKIPGAASMGSNLVADLRANG